MRTQFPPQDLGIKGVKRQTLHLSYRLVLSKMKETDKIMDEVLSIFLRLFKYIKYNLKLIIIAKMLS